VNQRREVVYRVGTGEEIPAMPSPPLLTSASTPWEGVLLERHAAESVETGPVACRNHVVFVHEGPAVETEFQINGEQLRRRLEPENVGVLPAGVPFSCRTRSRTSFVLVSLEPRFLDGVALDLSGKGWVELQPRLGIHDPLIHGISQALQLEAAAGQAASRLYGESLAAALAVHLAKEYSPGARTLVEPSGGLTRQQLRTAMDYLHAHLGENIHLEDLSGAVGISPFHFSRRFRRSTGVPPHRYLIRLRVQRARELLLRSSPSLAEVAVQVGFYDQSHLATHFKAAFGVTPGRFSAQRTGHLMAAMPAPVMPSSLGLIR
jgi:AraC family transcriptional regulator